MRLTKGMRTAIVNRVLDATFRDRLSRLADRESALATRVVAAAYGADVWQRIADLPDGWLPSSSMLRFTIDGGASYHKAEFRDARAMPASACWSADVEVPFVAAIHDELGEIKAERDAIRQQREQLKAEVHAVLNSVSTVERLAEVWPEGLAQLPPEWMAPKSVPAPLVEDLNKRIAMLREVA